jgi:hypothetical protein
MDDDYEPDDDRLEARRRHRQLIDRLDRDIEEVNSPQYQAEEAERQAASERWRNLPPSRAPLGTRTHRMTDEQIFHADREGN